MEPSANNFAMNDASSDPAMSHVPAPVEVTAIVPARNEDGVIAACVQALDRQPEIAEILVVDDQSTDRTADVVRALLPEIPHLRLLQTHEVPAGWVGKNNAVWLAAKQAKCLWLLFTDADAELGAGAVARALEIAEQNQAAVVSFSPEQVTKTWYEKSLIPFVYCRLGNYFSYDEVNDPASQVAAANGQFLMIRRDAYEAIGGHASVAGEILEDVALARRAKSSGHRIWFASSNGFVRARMYRSFSAMWEGWRKNLYQLLGGTPKNTFRELRTVVPWIPLLLVLIGIKVPFALLAGLFFLLVRQAGYGSALASNHFRRSYILYYISGMVLYAGVLWASYRAHAKGKVAWKGREVSVGVPGALR
jgi:cellulose synthase/poly-beta-1,6-N-acetylglucosamine synthase-like glycosyltransferase